MTTSIWNLDNIERIKTVKDLRGLTNSLRKEEEDQPTIQQDQLTTIYKTNSTI